MFWRPTIVSQRKSIAVVEGRRRYMPCGARSHVDSYSILLDLMNIFLSAPGCSVPGRRRDRRHAYTWEMVPWHRGPLPQLAQHHARAGRARCLLHAPGSINYSINVIQSIRYINSTSLITRVKNIISEYGIRVVDSAQCGIILCI